MPHSHVVLARILVSLALLARPVAAQATDPRATARDLANSAADAVAVGDHPRAEQLLDQAYQAYPAPTIALLHARTLVRLGRLPHAVSAYERATMTTLTPESPRAFWTAVRDARTELAALRPRVPRLRVALVGVAAQDMSELELSIDGEPLPASQSDRWLLVEPGTHVIRVKRETSVQERAVRLSEGQSAVIEVAAPTSSSRRWLTLGSLGVGAVGLGVGVVSGVLAGAAHEKAYAACEAGRCVEDTEGARQLKEFHRQRTISTVGYSVAAAGLGFGGFLLLRGSFDGPKVDVDVAVGSSPNGSAL